MASGGVNPKILIGMELDSKLAKAGFQTMERMSKSVASAMNSSINVSAKNLGIALNGVNSIVGTKLVSAFEKLGRQTGNFSKVTSIFQDQNKVLLQQEQILQRIMVKNRDARGRFTGGMSEQVKVISAGPIKPVNIDKTFGAPPKDVFSDIDIGKLAARAALTIPTWLALRAGIMSVLDVIPNAIDRFKELDSAVASMRILTDGADKFKNFSETAMESLKNLSRETGNTPTLLKDIYTSVSSTGIDASTSLKAMDVISKGAMATGADAKQLATTMAGLINTMGDTMDVGTNKGEQFVALMSMLHSVMKTNAGNMNDISEALAQAGSTAATSGMKMHELIANVGVLQTAMVKAGMGGTALRTALDQVVQKRQEVINFLDRPLSSEETTNQFVLIRSIVEKMSKMTSDGDLGSITKVQDVMQSIFGVKAGKDVNVLRNNLEKFNMTMQDLNSLLEIGRTKGVSAMAEKMNADFGVILDTLAVQQQRFGQIMSENTSALAGGLFGSTGKGWTETLEKLNNTLEKTNGLFRVLGLIIKNLALAGAILGFTKLYLAIALATKGTNSLRGAWVALEAVMLAGGRGKLLKVIGSLVLMAAAITGVEKAISTLTKDYSSEDPYSFLKTNSKFSPFYSAGKGNAKQATGVSPDFDINNPVDKTFARQAYMLGKREWARELLQNRSFKSYGTVADSDKRKADETAVAGLDSEARDRLFRKEVNQLQSLRMYGVDAIQLKERELDLVNRIYEGKEKQTKIEEINLELAKAQLDKQLQYSSSLQSSIKDSLLGNLQGKGNNLFSDIGANFTSQLQNSMADNLSKVLMSSGIGDQFAMAFGFLDEGAKRITDPVLKAHDEGGKKVHDWITSAFDKVTGSKTAGAGIATFSGSGNGLPGIWGSSTFTQGATRNLTLSNGQQVRSSTITPGVKPGTPNSWGKFGAGATIGATTAITAAQGFQQMSGGGAKNIVGGLGSMGMALGSGAIALSSAGIGAFGASAATLGALGPWGVAIGAVLMIASMFMKGAKSTQTSTQTSETKVGSKVDISNKKLELINRNLVALRNTMEIYALSTSAYFSEKNGTIDSEFALAGRRSY